MIALAVRVGLMAVVLLVLAGAGLLLGFPWWLALAVVLVGWSSLFVYLVIHGVHGGAR